MRALIVRLHRWAGVATALFLIVAGLTGSVLAFKNELEALLNPELFVVSPPGGKSVTDLLDPFVLRERVEQLYPYARADHLSFPKPDQASVFYLMPRLDPLTQQAYPLNKDQVFLNPYTGEILGDRKWGELFAEGRFSRENLIPFVWRLHEALALPHPWGKLLMGCIALIWTLDCFSGLVLTFPRGSPFIRKWQLAWQIKRGASLRRLNFDIHRATGLWLWLLLLVFAWSSVMLNLKEIVYQPTMSLLLPFESERPPVLPAQLSEPKLGWRQAHAAGQEALRTLARQQGFDILDEASLWYRPALGAYLYRCQTSLDIGADSAGTDLWIDAEKGRLLLVRHEGQGASGNVFSAWLRALHTGRVFGISYRIFVAALGVFVAILSVTGLVIWLIKLRARRAKLR